MARPCNVKTGRCTVADMLTRQSFSQNCCAGSRVYVQRSVYDVFLDRLVKKAESNVMGNPFDSNTFLGPQISGTQHSRIMDMIEHAKSQGAKCIAGGRSGEGWFVEPTIFSDVTQSMDLMRHEVFGPVVAIAPFDEVDEVLRMANDSCYGLAAGVFTSVMKQGLYMARELEAGSVWVNCYSAISHALPFGGYKESGNGRDLGEAALDEFTHLKTVRLRL